MIDWQVIVVTISTVVVGGSLGLYCFIIRPKAARNKLIRAAIDCNPKIFKELLPKFSQLVKGPFGTNLVERVVFNIVECDRNDGIECIQTLLINGAPVSGLEGHEVLRRCINPYTATFDIAEIVLSAGADPNGCNKDGESFVCFLAATYRDPGPLEVFVRHGADVTIIDKKRRRTALHAAVENCGRSRYVYLTISKIDILVKYGADINSDAGGRRPLSLAREAELQEYLRSLGAE